MSHTPGPWRDMGDFFVRDKESYSICTLNKKQDGPLIAAAPDLLEALEALVNVCGGTIGTHESHEFAIAASAAIKKAKGL